MPMPHIHIYIYIYIYIHVSLSIYLSLYIDSLSLSTYICIYIYTYTQLSCRNIPVLVAICDTAIDNATDTNTVMKMIFMPTYTFTRLVISVMICRNSKDDKNRIDTQSSMLVLIILITTALQLITLSTIVIVLT